MYSSPSTYPRVRKSRATSDDKELDDEVQRRVQELWPQISTENLHERTDFEGYKSEFLRLFGFGMPNVNYDTDVNPEVPIPHLVRL
jgi:enoyl-[acyl-carrier protein] reductase/trans-2-enoyl-CoA reductase (NAD+)